tara:strand:+ start:4689 stop:5639 length:951 start_codon:yes stop_codon:yes gene_type:complete
MKLSIIIPVYNVEKYIKRCLESIYIQNIPNDDYEVIIVNDGTPDSSIDIVNEFIKLHENIKLINQPNQGLSIARNNGLAKAAGDYVWFIDSDDWIVGNSINIIFKYLEQKHNVISTNLIYAYDDSEKNREERVIDKDVFLSASEYITKYSVGASQRYIIKRELLEKFQLKFYPSILHEDAEFNLRLVYYADNVFLIKKPLYNYYQGNLHSIMSSWNIKNSEYYFTIYKLLTEFWKEQVAEEMKLVVRIYTFRVLLMSIVVETKFTSPLFYQSIKSEVKKESLALITSKNISLKQRFIFFINYISPYFFKSLKNKLK